MALSDYSRWIDEQHNPLFDGLIDCIGHTVPEVSVRLNRRKIHSQSTGGGLSSAPSQLNVSASGDFNYGLTLNGSAAARGVLAHLCSDDSRAQLERVPWCSDGFYLPQRPDFTHDPALHQGLYYVQDASSMIIGEVVRQLVDCIGNIERPLRYLDACAAPGGKTTAAIDNLPDGSLVVANEFDFRRAEILKEVIMKWGYPTCVVSRGDTARFRRLPAFFDIVAADVPCSGEGMMRKDPHACSQWTPALVAECAARQREILLNLWETLAPGGYLIYSTCTFNTCENEQMMQWLIDETAAEPIRISVSENWGIHLTEHGWMRFLPTRLRGEGLFMAVLRKPTDGEMVAVGSPNARNNRSNKNKADKNRADRNKKGQSMYAKLPGMNADMLQKKYGAWLAGTGFNGSCGSRSGGSNGGRSANDSCVGVTFKPELRDDMLWAIAQPLQAEISQLENALDVIMPGVLLGTVKGREIVPSQALALSQALNRELFTAVDVDRATALAYLRREALSGFDAPKGALLLTFDGYPLGFANNLGNRANNLYPQAWRILS